MVEKGKETERGGGGTKLEKSEDFNNYFFVTLGILYF